MEIVVKLGKFTEEEQKTVELLSLVFGKRAAAYSMVLFTHGDQLRRTTIEEYIKGSDKLCHLLAKCNWRYHVFTNTIKDGQQLDLLLAKIRSMIRANGGSYYTNAMYQEAEKAIQEQAKRIMQVNAERKRAQEEKLRATLGGQQLQKEIHGLDEEYKRKSREKAEKKNKFLDTRMVGPAAEAGIAVGVAATALGGPLCMAVGAAAGGVAGSLLGLLVPTAARFVRSKCTVQ